MLIEYYSKFEHQLDLLVCVITYKQKCGTELAIANIK